MYSLEEPLRQQLTASQGDNPKKVVPTLYIIMLRQGEEVRLFMLLFKIASIPTSESSHVIRISSIFKTNFGNKQKFEEMENDTCYMNYKKDFY